MQFDSDLQSAFESASFDRNPLHSDPDYARRTSFGNNVVYGMGVALRCLSEWAAGRAFRLTSIQGEFRRPLFWNTAYHTEFTESETRVRCRVLQGKTVHANFEWAWTDYEAPQKVATSDALFSPRESPANLRDADANISRMHFQPELATLPLLLAKMGFFDEQMPAEQFITFLWSSYFVGMEVPGRQALFSRFSFQFREGRAARFLDLEKVEVECSSEFQQWTINATDSEVGDFELTAFRRPDAVLHSFAAIAAATPNKNALRGKTTVICGASRGFGAALTYALQAGGARVLAIARCASAESQEIEKSLQQTQVRGTVLIGDLSQTIDCQRLAASIKEIDSEVDCLILNASPAILPSLFLDQTPKAWLAFVERSLLPVITPCSSFLPLVRNGGQVVFISSVFAEEGRREFSHYTAAKAAIEGFAKSLEHEFPKLNFVIVRPRPMLTDQTATAIPMETLASAVDVAVELVSHLAVSNTPKEITLPGLRDETH